MNKQLRGIFLFLVYTFSVLLPHGALLAKSQTDEKTAFGIFFELRANWHQEKPLEPYKLCQGNDVVTTKPALGRSEQWDADIYDQLRNGINPLDN